MRPLRVGRLKAGSTTYDLRLAPHRGPSAYRPRYDLVWPQAQDIPGAEGKVAGDPNVREWVIDEWSSGEGETYWKEGFYRRSSNVRPLRTGDGVEIGANLVLTDHDNATPADFTEARRFGLGQGKLWAVRDTTVHEWQPTTDNWDETGTATGSTTEVPTCVIDQGDGTNLIIGYHSTHAARQVAPGGANAAVTGLTFTYAPVFRNWGGNLFWLNGDDLYSFTMSGAAATETLVADVTGNSSDYLTNGYEPWNRMSMSDKGPIWYQRTNSGETFIHEYNVNLATWRVLAKLPVDFAFPYSIFFSHGFYFVAFRYADRHAAAGDAYIYYFRAGQKGVAGPVRSVNSSTASKPILLAGMIGDDLCFYYDDAYWAYNLTSGGIYQIAESAQAYQATTVDAITFGQSIFTSNSSDFKAERAISTGWTTTAGTIDTGRFDFGYPGVKKVALDLTVVMDPLPAGNTVDLHYSAEGGTFTAVSGQASTTGITTFTWTISSDTGNVTGKDFEFRLTLDSDAATETPTIRSITARATAASKQRTWFLETDAGTTDTGSEGDSVRSADVLADVDTISQYAGVCLFTNPWGAKEEWDAAETHQVIVEKVLLVTPDSGDPFVQWQLREGSYV